MLYLDIYFIDQLYNERCTCIYVVEFTSRSKPQFRQRKNWSLSTTWPLLIVEHLAVITYLARCNQCTCLILCRIIIICEVECIYSIIEIKTTFIGGRLKGKIWELVNNTYCVEIYVIHNKITHGYVLLDICK